MQKKLYNSLYYLVLISIAILAIFLIRLIKLYDIFCIILDIFLPIFFGFIIAWLLKPIFKKMNKKLNKRLSFVILIALLIISYTLIIVLIVPMVIREGANLLSILNDFIPKLKRLPLLSGIENNFKIDPNFLLKYCNNAVSTVINFALAHIFGFYLLYNYNIMSTNAKKYLPIKYRDITLKFIRKLSVNMYVYIKGAFVDMLVLFIISAILFSIFKLKYAILLAIFCAITNIIPFVGPYIGGIPAVIVGLSSSIKLGLITLGIIILAQTLETSLINPLIMSKVVKINPLLIIIAVTIMGKFFGVIGMIFAVPVLILLKIVIEFINKYNLIKKNDN